MADVQLTGAQQEAVEEIERNLQLIACAGSGKTEVIARRIAHILEEKPELPADAIVAFTFTNKAAAALRERILRVAPPSRRDEISRMYIGTIHGYCHQLLTTCAPGFENVKVLDTVKQHHFIRRYHKCCGMDALGLDMSPIHVDVFTQCIEKMLDDYDNKDLWPQEQRDALEQYINCLREHRYVDFSILVFEALRQIAESPDCARAVSDVRYLVVDEYQDVDDMQEKLIGRFAESGANLCVVGDDDQTIYQFRGGNADNMITFAQRYPNVRQIRLETNFRCARGIVDAADTVIRYNTRRLSKEMEAAPSASDGVIGAMRFDSGPEQFSGVAEEIKKVHDSGIPWSQIAVLTRKGKTVARVTWALEYNGIPVCGDSAERFFEEEHFIRLRNTLKHMVGTDRAVIYGYWKDIADQGHFIAAYKGLRTAMLSGANPWLSIILRDFCSALKFLDEGTQDYVMRKTCLDGICRILDDYDEIYGDQQFSARIGGIMKFLDMRAAEEYKYYNFTQDDDRKDAVQVMTVHKAKGLEFPCVFLPDLMEKEFPVGNFGGKRYWHVLGGTFEENKERYRGGIEDERKLFYVAVTRAKTMLYMTYELSKWPVSRFVREAAKSGHLQIDADDLAFEPKRVKSMDEEDTMELDVEAREERDWEAERQARQAYWALVKTARQKLYDYYGTAGHFFPGAMGDLSSISSMSPEEILQKARENRLI